MIEGVFKMINHKVIAAASVIIMLPFSIIFAGEEVAAQPEKPKPPIVDSLFKAIPDAQEPVKEIPLTKARIKFDESEWNFGSIQKGSQVTHNFWFSNTGSEELVITRIKPACGCTTTKTTGMNVPPGGRSSIDISFNSGRFNNVITKGITVESNDALNPYLELRFTATINNPLQILETAPLEANFNAVLKGSPAEISMRITNVDSTTSKLVIIEKPSEDFIKTIPGKMQIKPKAATEIKFQLSPNIPVGPFVSSLTLEVPGKSESRVTIPILGTIVDQMPPPVENSNK
jgi:hypothetical protein